MKNKWLLLVYLFLEITKVSGQKELLYLKPDSLKEIVSFLASDSLKGRGDFTYSLEKAAVYISEKFEREGLQNLNGYTHYLQPFVVVDKKQTFEQVTVSGIRLSSEKYYFSCSYNLPPELFTDQFEIISLSNFQTNDIIEAANHFIDSVSKPILFVLPLAEKRKLNFLTKKAKQLHDPAHSFLIVISDKDTPDVHIQIKPEIRKKTLFNVIGVLPGKKLRDEIVLITAHYDHVGIDMNSQDSILNGANDNASGTAAMISLAKYFAFTKNNERTIIFVAFAGEEIGLIGSGFLADNLNCSYIKAMFNLEMVGKPGSEGKDEILITEAEKGSTLGKTMKKYCISISVVSDTNAKDKLFFRSDNYPFYLKKVPAYTFMCFTKGDSTYHKPSDELKTLDFINMSHLIKGLLPGIEAVVTGVETPKK